VSEIRSEKLSVLLTPSTVRQLDAYREPRRWSRSTAIAALVEQGLQANDETGKGTP
jgi:hypothetical protein